MKYYAVDFETYYDKEYSIKTMGVDAYINDPRFDPYLVAVYGEDIKWVGHPKDFDWSLLDGCCAVAHNARFDETVLERARELGIISKDINIQKWFCSSDLAVFLSAPRSLAGAAKALLGVTVDKSTRDKLSKLTYKEACEKGMKEEVDAYALGDAQHCYEIFHKYHDQWPEIERITSEWNREDSRRGVKVDEERLAQYIKDMSLTVWRAGNLIPWEWDVTKTPLSPQKLREQCRKEGIRCPSSLAKDNDDCVEWEHEYGEKYPWVGAMRDWRRANIMLKRLRTVEKRLHNGVLPYTIKYFGAHTGRFSGDGGFNMQNMPRGDNMGVDLRSLFIPREGKKMVVADLAQIEARIILWMAGDFNTLDKVAQGVSVYEAHAIATMGWDPDKGELKKANPKLYQLAKARVLGLGFGCGHKKFRVLARNMCGIELTDEEAKQTVADFRQTNPKIVSLWNRLHRDCAWSKGGDYEVELPSGRVMSYYDVHCGSREMTAFITKDGGRKAYIYGGKLAENVVQATARDVFIEGSARLHDLDGVEQLFHAHDEYVLEVDPDVPLEVIMDAITVTPDWLPRCPIGAEIDVVTRYTK